MDWSSESEAELQEDLLGLFDEVPGLAPHFLPQLPVQKPEDASSESKSEMEQEESHQGDAGSAPRGELSLLPRSSGHKWKREWSSEAKESEEGGSPQCFDLAPREEIRLPPRKRWREYLFLLEKELQEASGWLSPVPSTHTGVGAKPCGLKSKMKRRRLSSVLPEHHSAFTRLLEDPVIKRFLAWDKNLRASDKNLLAMVIAYFSRAGLFPWQYRRIHFFLALYLANDMEEDNEAPKLDMLFFLCGMNFDKIPQFQKLRYLFICCMGWDLRVTREECEEIQAFDPVLWVWGRDRTLIQEPWSPKDTDLKKVHMDPQGADSTTAAHLGNAETPCETSCHDPPSPSTPYTSGTRSLAHGSNERESPQPMPYSWETRGGTMRDKFFSDTF